MPAGIRARPSNKSAGSAMKARIPMYGCSTSPVKVVGRRKSQKTVDVVTITTPTRLNQSLERWMSGKSHAGQPEFSVGVMDIGLRYLHAVSGQKCRIEGIDVGIENRRIQMPDQNGESRQYSLIKMNRRGDIQPCFRQQGHCNIICPQHDSRG